MNESQPSGAPRPHNRLRGAINGAIMTISATAVGIVGWLLLSMLAHMLESNPDLASDMNPLARCLVERGWAVAMLVAPSLLGGLILMIAPLSRGKFWLITIGASLWLAMIFGTILFCFLMFIGPLYQPQTL